MLGKKLYNLIQELDTSERKLIYYRAKKSEDKRFKYLFDLLQESDNSLSKFQDNIEQVLKGISPASKSVKEKNDATRRFIDFCVKEIEGLKVELYVKANPGIRNYILSEVFNKADSQELQEDYIDKLGKSADEKTNYWLKYHQVIVSANLKTRSQTIKDIDEWRQLVNDQNSLLNEFYQHELSAIYDKVSSSYLDDRNTLNNFDQNFLSEENINKQIELSQNAYVVANLNLSLARFNFENQAAFYIYCDKAEDAIEGLKNKESDLIRRKINFAKFLSAFHYNISKNSIVSLLDKIVEIDNKYLIKDPKIYFYYFLLNVITGNKKGNLNYFNINSKSYFKIDKSKYLYEFVEAIEKFKSADFKGAKKILLNLSYSNNPYLATWARLIEIVINIKQGNTDLAESYYRSETKRVGQSFNRMFTINSSVIVLSEVSKALAIKLPNQFKEVAIKKSVTSPIHELIIDILKNK